MSVHPFQTRARTVDHLGREQIADTPTAVSELWKNSYDAYARTVGLHVFDGDNAAAALLDDGSGMTESEFVSRWLVLGTDAKLSIDSTEQDRNGLEPRVRQGQKGIGRLSVAFLGPLCLVITKRQDCRFVASLVDWRFFENPSLMLEDIRIPVLQFDGPPEFPDVLKQLVDASMDNVWGRNGEPERNQRIESAWRQNDAREIAAGVDITTAHRIAMSAMNIELSDRHLSQWPVWKGEAQHGTALFILELKEELRAWIPHQALSADEFDDLRESLAKTLTGFVDPFVEHPIVFRYEVVVHRGRSSQIVLSNDNHFTLQQLRSLEHYIEGECDEYGLLTARVRAFGKDLGEVTIAPASPVKSTRHSRVGPFRLCIGTFEQEEKKSSHPAEVHSALLEQAAQFAGLRIYRDGLRVMPYGRPENDFFEIEARRSSHAGREFWVHRRMFGRIALTSRDNPNLRDKAGREGLIDNTARREFKRVVTDILKAAARRYFGSASEYRDQLLPEIAAFKAAAAAADQKALRLRSRAFFDHLKANSPSLDQALQTVDKIRTRLDGVRANHSDEFLGLAEPINETLQLRSRLKPPPRPAKLGRAEAEYRSFRDRYNMLAASVDRLSQEWARRAEEFAEKRADEIARSWLARHQRVLTDEIGTWTQQIRALLELESERIEQRSQSDRSEYYRVASPILAEVERGTSALRAALAELERLKNQTHQKLNQFYPPYLRALQKLAADVDLDSALSWTGDQRAELEERVAQLSSLAQLGVTVEIIGHEFERLDYEVSRNLRRLPEDVRKSDAFQLAMSAHQALVNRLRFLAPLKLSGPQLREVITGDQIFKYVAEFFSEAIADQKVTFRATEAFRRFQLTDFTYRIYPVFVNLVNNSLYWLRQVVERQIVFDMVDNSVVVADSGPGVDPDDVDQLFNIYFTRRLGGRGVGLHLSRINLAASGHRIEYSGGGPVLSGANFIIRFQES